MDEADIYDLLAASEETVNGHRVVRVHPSSLSYNHIITTKQPPVEKLQMNGKSVSYSPRVQRIGSSDVNSGGGMRLKHAALFERMEMLRKNEGILESQTSNLSQLISRTIGIERRAEEEMKAFYETGGEAGGGARRTVRLFQG